jgi:hypothetical protein
VTGCSILCVLSDMHFNSEAFLCSVSVTTTRVVFGTCRKDRAMPLQLCRKPRLILHGMLLQFVESCRSSFKSVASRMLV